MGFCSCTTKFVLFFFNLACALLGLTILGIGVYMNIEGKSFKNLLDGEITLSTILLISIGGAVFLIAFFGCCGAIREDPCCLNTYAVILSALLLCQIAVGVIAFVYRNNVQKGYSFYVEQKFKNATEGDPAALKEISDLQKSIECCGVEGPNYWSQHGKQIPPSCCKGKESCAPEDAFQYGCKDKGLSLIRYFLQIMGIAAISVGGVELVGVVFAFCLASSIRRREMRGYA